MPQAIRKKEPSPPLAPKLIRLLREAALYVLGAVALYVLVALGSYVTTDPSWSHRGATEQVQNLGGPFGAFIADLFFNLLGYLAYMIPLWIAYAGVTVFLHRKDEEPVDIRHKLVVAAGGAMAALGACGLAALHFSQVGADVPFNSGGVVGDLVATALVAGFHFTGATIVLLLIMFLPGLTIFLGISWLRVMDAVGWAVVEGVLFIRSRFRDRQDRKLGEEAKVERKAAVERDKRWLDKHKPPRIEPVIATVKPSARSERERQVSLFDFETPAGGELPALSLLDEAEAHNAPSFSRQSLESVSRLVEKKLLDFNIEAQVVEVHPGPVITRFELEPAAGIKASQITNLAKDLARSLSVISLRVVEVIPGKTTVGLEVPNESRETVRLREVLSSQEFDEVRSPLTLALGKDISGKPTVEDLAKMPHLLIAGTTGSGKSVCVNGLILSMVYKATPDQVRLIMVDPKMLELSIYEGIPHLLAPVVTDMKQAANALRWCIGEMERRYRLMAALGVRNIGGYNRKVKEAIDAGKPLKDPLFEPIEGIEEEAPDLKTLPYIVILIDELADLMMVVGKKVEQLIARLAQKARAAGLHLILATQRPSVDVITGLIKANIPARIAFQVSSRVDSRTVLDQMGAEQLLGHGDMLFLQPGQGVPLRVHGSFVDDHEVHNVVAALKKGGKPLYNEAILSPESVASSGSALSAGMDSDDEQDPLYDEALAIVTETRKASISGVQRRLRIGYNRAARLIEQMEKSGVVGPLQSNGAREVLAPAPPKG